MEFHEQLKALREGKNLTQEQLSKMVGIAKNTYIGYEKGEREPRLGELIKLAQCLSVSMDKLCIGYDVKSMREDLVMLFREVQDFNEDEVRTFVNVVQGLVIKHHSEKIKLVSNYVMNSQ